MVYPDDVGPNPFNPTPPTVVPPVVPDTTTKGYRSMADKRQEYEMRVRQCMEAVKGIMTEAKIEGFSIGASAHLDVNGEPQVTVAVLMR